MTDPTPPRADDQEREALAKTIGATFTRLGFKIADDSIPTLLAFADDAIRSGFRRVAPEPVREAPRDLPEKQYGDGSRGKYQCKCAVCGAFFIGHKLDPACPECALRAPAEPQQQGGEAWLLKAFHDGWNPDANHDEARFTVHICRDRGDVVAAVWATVFGQRDGEADHAREVEEIVDALMRTGRITFEGDPPLELERVALAAPAPAAPAGVTIADAMVEAAARTWFDLSVMSQANGWCAVPESARVVYLDRMRAALAAALAAQVKP